MFVAGVDILFASRKDAKPLSKIEDEIFLSLHLSASARNKKSVSFARMYAPEIGRFLQTDPLGYIDTINPYAYCANNPTNFVDPSGEWITIAIGAAGGAISGYLTGGWGGALAGAVGGAMIGSGNIAGGLAVLGGGGLLVSVGGLTSTAGDILDDFEDGNPLEPIMPDRADFCNDREYDAAMLKYDDEYLKYLNIMDARRKEAADRARIEGGSAAGDVWINGYTK